MKAQEPSRPHKPTFLRRFKSTKSEDEYMIDNIQNLKVDEIRSTKMNTLQIKYRILKWTKTRCSRRKYDKCQKGLRMIKNTTEGLKKQLDLSEGIQISKKN